MAALPPGEPWDARDLPVPVERSFDGLVGLEHLEVTPERAAGRVVVRPELLGPDGTLHGGVCAAVSESLTSSGTFSGVAGEPRIATGMSNTTTVVAPVTGGVLEAVAVRTHASEDLWMWSVEIRDAAGRLCAVSTMAIAVRPAPAAPARPAVAPAS